GALILGLAALTGVALWKTSAPPPFSAPFLVSHPEGVMGTTCTLVAVTADPAQGQKALRDAESVLRRVEGLMSTWLSDSEISRLNQAAAGEEVALSPETLLVLDTASGAALETDGAFDVTCRPVIELWREAAERGSLPSDAELENARAASSWELIELTPTGASKQAGSARVDLGGIAKGYGIDQSLDAMRAAGVLGALVDVGGDLRCFGQPPQASLWMVDVRDPFSEGRLAELGVWGAAVCTSGDYARFVEIEGRRYSHIADPRTGRLAEAACSVTVVAQTAMEADIWATALSVLGRDGIERLPSGVEAMLVIGEADDYDMVCTPGFKDMMREPLPEGLTLEGKASAVTEASPQQPER
ncbi:MAG: FAD:protein FMN transferase, partial [Armatimonadetes bacterium]|nr:FAD:protein FMN transferase [Armatimonadota bacterium]